MLWAHLPVGNKFLFRPGVILRRVAGNSYDVQVAQRVRHLSADVLQAPDPATTPIDLEKLPTLPATPETNANPESDIPIFPNAPTVPIQTTPLPPDACSVPDDPAEEMGLSIGPSAPNPSSTPGRVLSSTPGRAQPEMTVNVPSSPQATPMATPRRVRNSPIPVARLLMMLQLSFLHEKLVRDVTSSHPRN